MSDTNTTPHEEEPISLVPDDEGISLEDSGETHHSVKAFGARGLGVEKKSNFKRALNMSGTGATRCRMFHSRIAQAPLEYMEKQINDWLDGELIEVKHVGHVIGTLEGKTPEPNVIVMVWY